MKTSAKKKEHKEVTVICLRKQRRRPSSFERSLLISCSCREIPASRWLKASFSILISASRTVAVVSRLLMAASIRSSGSVFGEEKEKNLDLEFVFFLKKGISWSCLSMDHIYHYRVTFNERRFFPLWSYTPFPISFLIISRNVRNLLTSQWILSRVAKGDMNPDQGKGCQVFLLSWWSPDGGPQTVIFSDSDSELYNTCRVNTFWKSHRKQDAMCGVKEFTL